MPNRFRKTSIKSRKRTLALAGLGLIVETIVSHPRVDVTAMVNVATLSRFAAPLMASFGGVAWTAETQGNAAAAPVAGPDRFASFCRRTHHADS